MPLPKKKKFDINVYPGYEGAVRVEEIMQKSDDKTTFLPPSITIEDIETEMFNLLNKGRLIVTGRNGAIPCIFMNDERWATFSKTWMISDVDKNISTPFITMKRKEVLKGTYRGDSSNIPNKKEFQYLKVPNYENGVHGYDIYKIPQPSPVDIEYDVQLFSRNMHDINTFSEKYLSAFTDMQVYINVNGHYFEVLYNESVGMDMTDSLDNVEGDRYYVTTIGLTVKAYLQNQEKFIKEKSINRVIATMEVGDQSTDLTFETGRKIKTVGNKGFGYVIVYDKYNPGTPIKVMSGFRYTGYTAPDVTVFDEFNPDGVVTLTPGETYTVDPYRIPQDVSLEFQFPPYTINEIMLVIAHPQAGEYTEIHTENVDGISFHINGDPASYPFTVVGGDMLVITIVKLDDNMTSLVDLSGITIPKA
jgi:hypothetical protein